MRNQFQQAFRLSFVRIIVAALLVLTALPGRVVAQQNNAPGSSPTASTVPPIIQFSGQFSATAGGGSAPVPAGTVSITFTLYESEQGGTALWSETDNVQVDAQGKYTALLGSTSPQGLPLNLFTAGQAHWLAVQPLVQGFAEQPRVMLVGVPYAMKAADADTVGGLPASAFLLAQPTAAPSPNTGNSSGASGNSSRPTVPTTGTIISGGGSVNYLPVWTSTQILGNSVLYQTGGNVGINTTSPVSALDVNGGINTSAAFNIGGSAVLTAPGGLATANIATGYQALVNNTSGASNTASGTSALYSNNTGYSNVASGASALYSNTAGYSNAASGTAALFSNNTGTANTASGYEALFSNTSASGNVANGYQALYTNNTGIGNTANGFAALYSNTTAGYNTANGYEALYYNSTGAYNTATGYQALVNNSTAAYNTATGYQSLLNNTTGYSNLADGYSALYSNTTGYGNTAIGAGALYYLTEGGNNIAIGAGAGTSVPSVTSGNIDIGNPGSFSDNGVTRIGYTGGNGESSFYAAGIAGVNVSGATVIVSSSGQLGVASSSRRYKEDIHDMGDASEGLMRLRPVTFRYKKPFDDGTKPIQYGLIAEEVAEVFPDLVARSADGRIETVKYQLLDPMLLNEVQRQQKEMQREEALIGQQRDQLKTQEAQIAELVLNVKTIQASLRTRHGSGHAKLASVPTHTEAGRPVQAATDASLQAGSSSRGGN